MISSYGCRRDILFDMPIPELVDYVRTQTQEGVGAEYLRTALMEAGWQELDIDNALHDVAAGLHPATPGASIHEDLAQVRGLVAHLATRIKGVEARLASIPGQAMLPTSYIGADHEITDKPMGGMFIHIISILAAFAAAIFLGKYATELIQNNSLSPRDFTVIIVALGAFLIDAGVVTMRRGRGWIATMLTAFGLMLWTAIVGISWRVYEFIQWPVALALGVLLLVIALVMSRWIEHLKR